MRLAVWQCAPFTGNPAGALTALDRAAAQAAAQGSTLLVAPEMLVSGYAIGAAKAARLARPADGEYHEAVAGMARRHGLTIAFGYPEKTAEGTRNAAALIEQRGYYWAANAARVVDVVATLQAASVPQR